MKRFFILLFLFFIIKNTFSQSRIIDSLKTFILSAKEDTSKVNALNCISHEYNYHEKYDTALLYANKAIELSKQLSFTKGTAIALKEMCLIYFYQGNYPKALEYAFNSLKIAEQNKYKLIIASNYINIGNILFYQENYDESLIYYQKGMKIDQELNDKYSVALDLRNIGNIHIIKKDYDKALDYYRKSLQLVEELKNNEEISISYGNIALVFANKEAYDLALEYNLKALKIKKEIGSNKKTISLTLNNIGVNYMNLKKYQESENYLKMALNSSLEINDLKGVEETNYFLSKLYAKQNKWKLSLDSYKNYTLFKDSILNETTNKQIAEMQTKYEVEKKENELVISKKENQVAEYKKYILIISLVALSLIAVTLLSRQQIKIKKQKEAYEIKQQLIQADLERNKIEKRNLQTELLHEKERLNNFTNLMKEKTQLLEKMQEQLDQNATTKTEDETIKRLLTTVEEFIDPNKYWEEFITSFNLVHQDFFERLNATFPDLTRYELRLCALIKCDLGYKEIANVLHISPDSVKRSRNRLRKKLNLEEDENLTKFILGF